MLHLDGNGKRKAMWIGAVMAPIVGVQAVRLLDGPGPAVAPAAVAGAAGTDQPVVDLAGIAAKPLSESQRLAVAFLKGYQPSEQLRSPMDGPDPVAPIIETRVADPRIVPQTPEHPEPDRPKVDPLAGLSVSAIVGSGESSVAMIAHRLRRVGDEVAPGWRVASIDGKHRQVILSGPGGETATLMPPTPGE